MAWYDPVVREFHQLPDWAEPWVLAIVYALVAYAVGRLVKAVVRRFLHNSPRVEDTLERFLVQMVSVLTAVLVVLAFLRGLGVDPAALLGGLAIGGFILGFALKDVLGNLAAGVILLLYRPFKVGEAVQVKGQSGVVEQLGIALTRLKTWDGVFVAIPNGTILSEAIVNYSRNATRRVDVNVGIDYKDDVEAAIRGAMDVVTGDERVLADPKPQVVVTGLGESSVDLQVRAWVPTSVWGDARSDIHHRVKKAIEDAGCSIPFPQRDLHVYNMKVD